MCLFCKKKINLSFTEKLQQKVDAVPQEKKQQLLDLLHEGKTIGQARDSVGLELIVAGEIITQNIVATHFLGREAK